MSDSPSKAQKVSVESIKPTAAAAPSRALSYFEETEQELERVFDSLLSRFRPLRAGWSAARLPLEGQAPRVDVVDNEDNVTVRAQLPGVDKKDLDVSVNHDTVTLKASTRTESKEEKGDYYRREIATGYFSRTIALPAEVDGKKASAHLKDGVLELILPKIEKSKRQRIEVK
jgi:HSP20 family protein